MIAEHMAQFGTSEARNWITPEFKARFLASVGDQTLRSVRRLLPGGKDLRAHVKVEERAVDQAVKREAAVSASYQKHCRRQGTSPERGVLRGHCGEAADPRAG